MKTVYFECSCHAAHHLFRITYFPDEKDVAYFEVHLTPGSFWERLENGLKYIFGIDEPYGHFDEVIMDKDTIIKLRNVAEEFLK